MENNVQRDSAIHETMRHHPPSEFNAHQRKPTHHVQTPIQTGAVGTRHGPHKDTTRCGPYTKDYTNTTYPRGLPAQGLTDHRTRENHTPRAYALAVPTAKQTLHSSCHTNKTKRQIPMRHT